MATLKESLPECPRILAIALRRIGDVLLTTPLIRSLARAWPDAVIDALVFAGTEGILQGNGDLRQVIAMPHRAGMGSTLRLICKLWRRYDLAIAVQAGDRPHAFAWIAGKRRVALVDPHGGIGAAIKHALLVRAVPEAPDVHRVELMLRLADAIGIARAPDVIAPRAIAACAPAAPYAVIHATPMYRYKQWTAAGWRTLARHLRQRGLAVIAVAGPSEAERAFLAELLQDDAAVRQWPWPQIAALLADARVFIGTDTAATHLAAATGCPTVAIYGPTDPRLWGPWPRGGLAVPWDASGTIQNRGNVWLVQNPFPCLPCQLEGCERRRDSRSACLDRLAAEQVLAAVDRALA